MMKKDSVPMLVTTPQMGTIDTSLIDDIISDSASDADVITDFFKDGAIPGMAIDLSLLQSSTSSSSHNAAASASSPSTFARRKHMLVSTQESVKRRRREETAATGGKPLKTSSPFHGVTVDKRKRQNQIYGRIKENGINRQLGFFLTEVHAALAYDDAARPSNKPTNFLPLTAQEREDLLQHYVSNSHVISRDYFKYFAPGEADRYQTWLLL